MWNWRKFESPSMSWYAFWKSYRSRSNKHGIKRLAMHNDHIFWNWKAERQCCTFVNDAKYRVCRWKVRSLLPCARLFRIVKCMWKINHHFLQSLWILRHCLRTHCIFQLTYRTYSRPWIMGASSVMLMISAVIKEGLSNLYRDRDWNAYTNASKICTCARFGPQHTIYRWIEMNSGNHLPRIEVY